VCVGRGKAGQQDQGGDVLMHAGLPMAEGARARPGAVSGAKARQAA
jgi:hypothetical protein